MNRTAIQDLIRFMTFASYENDIAAFCYFDGAVDGFAPVHNNFMVLSFLQSI